MFPLFIGLLVIVISITGYFVFKAEQKKDEHNVVFLDTQTKSLAVAEKALNLASVKSPAAAFIATHLGTTNSFAMSEPRSKSGSILVRKWLQNLQVLAKDTGVELIALGKDSDSYPPGILVSLKMGEQVSVLKLESTFVAVGVLVSAEDLSIWAEEDGPNTGQLWISDGFQLYNAADCDSVCSTEIYTNIRAALTDESLGSCMYHITRASSKGKIMLWKLRSMMGGGGNFVLSELTFKPTMPELVDASYVAPIMMNGKKFSTSGALEAIATAAATHGRAVITAEGSTGTGKTRFLTAAMQQFVGKIEKLNVLQIIPGSLFPGYTDKILLQTNAGPVLLVVEDAHLLKVEELAELNNLLDGLETPDNLHAIVAYNQEELAEEKKKYIEALTRPQRSQANFKFGPMTKVEAQALYTVIKANPDYKLVPGTVVTDGMTLAQVWAGVQKRPLADFIV